MSRDPIDHLVDTWTRDPAFRARLAADPAAACAAAGIALPPEVLDAVAILDLEELGAGGLPGRASFAPIGDTGNC